MMIMGQEMIVGGGGVAAAVGTIENSPAVLGYFVSPRDIS